MDFAPTLAPRRPKVGGSSFKSRNAAEERYWKQFRSSVFIKSYAPIVALHFSQTSPYRYVVTSGTRLQIYNSRTNRVVKTISKFKEIARSGNIRDDGNLVIGADDSGLVQIFDIKSRAVLRSIRAHRQPVHTSIFSPTSTSHGKPTFLTASDDTTLKLYDLSTSEQISYLAGHGDYVRTAAYVPSNPSLIISGSYDGTAKLWDTRIPSLGTEADDIAVDDGMEVDEERRRRPGRTPPPGEERGLAREVMSFNHGQPVERVLVHPSGTQVITAGGPVIKVFDMLSSGQCLRAMSNHQKTVTCLEWGDGRPFSSAGSGKQRLLSAGLDGLIKSYDIEDDYRVGKTMRVGGGVLSLAMAPDEGTLLVGTANGELTVRKRILSASEKAGKKKGGFGGVDALNAGPGEYEAILAAAGVNAQTSEEVLEALPTQEENRAAAIAQQQSSLVQRQSVNPATGEIKVRPVANKKKLAEWDRLLKSFRYSDALDSVCSKGVHPAMAFALIRELMHRDGLHQALNARDEVSLLPILRFLYDHIADPRYGSTACDVAGVVVDLYTPALGQSTLIDNLFGRMNQKVQREVEFQHNLLEVRGQLQMILAAQA